ncbi:MAG: protoporphyrinogen oxidase, partial [Actinomycetales bacterium]|nr:protoporphyrinogen oxidase [Actinomycetales bacterium]
QLPATLVERLTERGVTVRSGTIVRELHRAQTGWRVVSGPVPAPEVHEADRVVLALPAVPTARLLRDVAPEASAALGTVETASMAVLTFAFDAGALPELTGSGFLVPPRDGRFIKAATFSAVKWDWVRAAGEGAGPGGADLVLLRASVGRHREASTLQHPDAVLLDRAHADLALALDAVLPRPVARHVQRWGGGLPQYAVGHLDLVATVRESVATCPGLAVAGATYEGVGIPACIATGRQAARELLGH